MLSESVFKLKGFSSVFDTTITNEIADNLVEFFDWGLLNKGNFFNVNLNEEDSVLSLSENPNFENGQVWRGNHPNWVWQSGVNFNNSSPISISGVYVNNTFYPSNTSGVYSHYIDYRNGCVIFNQAIPTTGNVKVEHSYKWINVEYSETENMRTITNNSNEEIFPELISKLPVIAIEPLADRKHSGYQLGGGQILKTTVLFHCVAEHDTTRNTLLDIVSFQNDKSIYFFNSKQIAQSGDFPIDHRGSPVPGALNYEELVTEYPSYLARFSDVSLTKSETKNNSLSVGVVKLTIELVKLSI
jgi:hypothetical protein